MGAFILLVVPFEYFLILQSFIFLPEKVSHRSSLGIAISLAALLINVSSFRPTLSNESFVSYSLFMT